MPNSDVKRGLVPVRYASGSPYMGANNRYAVEATNANPLFVGDPVVKTGSGVGAYASVTRAAAATAFDGVIVGFQPSMSREQLGYLPANTAGTVLVADEDDLEYEVQANAAMTVADFGQNAGLVIADGETAYRRSNVELDQGSLAATATLPVHVIGFMDREDNDLAAAQVKVRVRKANGKAGV